MASLDNCNKIWIPLVRIIIEEFVVYREVEAALCFDHLHLGGEMLPLSQVEKVKVFP